MVPSLSKIFIENSHQNIIIRAVFKDKDAMFTETDKEKIPNRGHWIMATVSSGRNLSLKYQYVKIRTWACSPRFKIMSLNIFSLLPHLDELRIFVDSEKPHIICINETKLDDSIDDDSLVHIDGYAIIRKDRNKHGGGVALYIHQNINFELKGELMCDEIESISVQIKNGKFKPFIVTSIYRPPGKPVSYFDKLEYLFGQLESQNKESIILGDTNCDFDTPANNTKHLNNILNSFGYSQLRKNPTRTTSTTSTIIDHLMTNRPEIISGSGVVPYGISDHDALYLIRNIRALKLKAPPKVSNVRNYKLFNIKNFQSDLKTIPMEHIKLVSKDANEV